MRFALVVLMLANAGLFLFGALQHAGISVGRFHEPYILPAAIVESVCGVALAWGGAAVLAGWRGWGMALAGNLVALAGVLLGKAALAAGRGPRTASNDLYHNIMLILIGTSISLLVAWPILRRSRDGARVSRRHYPWTRRTHEPHLGSET
jgi:hypothetical protein